MVSPSGHAGATLTACVCQCGRRWLLSLREGLISLDGSSASVCTDAEGLESCGPPLVCQVTHSSDEGPGGWVGFPRKGRTSHQAGDLGASLCGPQNWAEPWL